MDLYWLPASIQIQLAMRFFSFKKLALFQPWLVAAAWLMVKDRIELVIAKLTTSIVQLEGKVRIVTPLFCNVIPRIASEAIPFHVSRPSIFALDAWARRGLTTRQTTGILEDDALSIVATQATERLRPKITIVILLEGTKALGIKVIDGPGLAVNIIVHHV